MGYNARSTRVGTDRSCWRANHGRVNHRGEGRVGFYLLGESVSDVIDLVGLEDVLEDVRDDQGPVHVEM